MGAAVAEWIDQHPVLFEGNLITVRQVSLEEKIEDNQNIEYWASLKDGEKRKVSTIFALMDSNNGTLFNREKYKKLEDYHGVTIQEIKSGQARIGCIWEEGYNLMLLFGCNKKKDTWKAGDLKQLRNIYDKYAEKRSDFLSKSNDNGRH